MNKEEIQQAVKDELSAFKGETVEEVRQVLSDETAEDFKKMEASLGEVSLKLVEIAKHGETAPDAQVVKDLEARLDEAEAGQGELKEQVRLAIASQVVVPAGDPAEKLDFKGCFVKVTPELKAYLRSYWMGGLDNVEERVLGSGLFATGGKLPAEVADAFIDFVIEQQATLSRVVTIRMNAPQGHTDELRVSVRKIRKAVEATAPTVADSVTTHRQTLDTVETILAEDITMTFLEDNIERAGAESHIARIIATAFGNDSNDLVWNGDEASSDPFISINDGLLLKFQNSVDGDITDSDEGSSTTNTQVLQNLLEKMPDQFLGRTDHAYWMAVTFAQKYADEVSKRETALGDQVLIQGFPALRYFGIPIIPETHIKSASRRGILTPTTNIFWGVQRVFRIDSEFIPRRRVIEYTLSARTDVNYATGVPVVNGFDIPLTIN
jgi:hypothetical protein